MRLETLISHIPFIPTFLGAKTQMGKRKYTNEILNSLKKTDVSFIKKKKKKKVLTRFSYP